MNRVFRSDLSVKGLRKLQKELRAYQRRTLPDMLTRFISELADTGVYIAKLNAGRSNFAPYVAFVKEVKDTKYLYKPTVVIIGKNAVPCFKQWYKDNELIEREVNALMMTEYGSGQYAEPFGYRGTFPEQTHADENGWWYATEKDAEGNFVWHYTHGEIATEPMRHARDAVIRYVDMVAQRVFG